MLTLPQLTLWDFLVEYIFPLFGTVPEKALEDLQTLFWIVLGSICIHFLVYLPYRGILALMRVKKWRR